MGRLVRSRRADGVRSHPIPGFFDSSPSYYLLSGSSSASHSLYRYSMGINTESSIIIIYAINQIMLLHGECQ